MSELLTDKMKNCKHPQDDIWPDGSCPHCGWNRWIQYFETQEEVDQFEYEKKLSSKDKKDLVKEYLALERQLAEAREQNYKLEKIIQDFDGSVRYLMTVAPQLDNILKNNLLRLKEQG